MVGGNKLPRKRAEAMFASAKADAIACVDGMLVEVLFFLWHFCSGDTAPWQLIFTSDSRALTEVFRRRSVRNDQ